MRVRKMKENFDKSPVVALLNEILEMELAGVVHYTHYALMVFGYNRLPDIGFWASLFVLCLAGLSGEYDKHPGCCCCCAC